jgi:hypothetical protein
VSNPDLNFNINTNPTGSPTLGSVTHKFRKRNFKAALVQARWILIIAGCWSLLVQAFMTYYLATSQLEREVRDALAAGADQSLVEAARQEAMSPVKILVGVQVAIGVIFIAAGFALKLAPVPIAIGCLVIYAAFHLGLALIYPASIFMGLFGKAVFVAALFIAVRSTSLYRRDLRQAELEIAAREGATLQG